MRSLEEKRLQLQTRFTAHAMKGELLKYLTLFDDVCSWVASYFRDAATCANAVNNHSSALRRLQQSKALDDAARTIKETVQALTGNDQRVRVTYL
eukprot:3261658-Rhodomonas_salina.1